MLLSPNERQICTLTQNLSQPSKLTLKRISSSSCFSHSLLRLFSLKRKWVNLLRILCHRRFVDKANLTLLLYVIVVAHKPIKQTFCRQENKSIHLLYCSVLTTFSPSGKL